MERILYIDELLRSQRYPKKRSIAGHFEVSDKTIERDIDYMRDRLGAPIAYSRERGGYCYEEAGYYLPALHMKQDEALALFISHYLGNAWKGTPLSEAAEELWKRLSGMMQEEILIDTAAFNETVFLVDQSVELDAQMWLDIFTATRNRHKILMSYRSRGHAEAAERTLHPYRLIHHRNNWYVLGYDEYRRQPLIFSISRIEGLHELEETFRLPENFSISDYIDPRFGIHIGGEPFEVTITADRSLSQVITEHIPAAKKRSHTLDRERIAITFETNQREELKHWLLQWGQNIEVVEPCWIQRELAEIGKYYVRKYSETGKDGKS